MTHDDSFDDFPADDHEAHEAAADSLPEHDVPEHHDWDEHDPIGKPAKKKSGEKWIIGGAVAIGLVIVVLKMGGGHAPPRQTARSAPPAKTMAAATPAPAGAGMVSPAKPLLNLPPTKEDVIYGAAKTTPVDADTAVPDTAKPPQTGFLNDPDALKKVEAMQAAHIPAAAPPADTTDANTVPHLVIKEVASAPPVTPPAPSMAPVAAPAITPVMAQPLTPPADVDAKLDAKLKDIVMQLAAITTQLQDLQTNTVRKTALDDLQKQVTALKDHLAQQPATAGVVSDMAAQSAPHHAATTHSKVHHAAPATMASHWTLKSAQPGIAIVDSGNGKLVTVQAGDHLKGIGTVKSITQVDGQWVVNGSAGHITQ